MGTQAEGKVRFMRITRAEHLAAQVMGFMAAVTLEALPAGGYRPTPEQLGTLAKEVTRAALALGKVIDEAATNGEAPSDDAIDEAAEHVARVVLIEVMGPPNREALN